jgi:hypothetical protein
VKDVAGGATIYTRANTHGRPALPLSHPVRQRPQPGGPPTGVRRGRDPPERIHCLKGEGTREAQPTPTPTPAPAYAETPELASPSDSCDRLA